jgi:hypothetical protein
MVATLATLGEVVEDYVVVEKILCCVPPCLKQIAPAIAMLLDVRSLTIANLLGRLKGAEEVFEESPSMLQQDGKLYLTKEEWDARRARCNSKKQNSAGLGKSSNNGGRGAVITVGGVDVVAGAGMEIVGHRKLTSAGVVVKWAIRTRNVNPSRRRSKPIPFRMRRLH